MLRASGVPDEIGVFVFGPSPTQIPFGNGLLCVGGNLRRSPTLVGVHGKLTWSPDLGGLLPVDRRVRAALERLRDDLQEWIDLLGVIAAAADQPEGGGTHLGCPYGAVE